MSEFLDVPSSPTSKLSSLLSETRVASGLSSGSAPGSSQGVKIEVIDGNDQDEDAFEDDDEVRAVFSMASERWNGGRSGQFAAYNARK